MMPKLIPFLAVIVAIALFLGYIKPTFTGAIADLKSQSQVDDQALAAAQRFKDREAELTTQRNAIPAENLTRIEAYVPDNVDTVHVVIDLNALAARTGVKLADYAVSNKANNDDLTNTSITDPVELTFTATGTYSAFRAFLGGLESSLRPYDVVNINVKNSSTGVYTYTITVRTYALH
jgi:hypothetical protein